MNEMQSACPGCLAEPPLARPPRSAITEALKAAATLALTCKKVPLATEFRMRARDHIAERELLDWAETLLCNAECPKHCKPDEWRDILKRWRDQKHGVSPNAKLTPLPLAGRVERKGKMETENNDGAEKRGGSCGCSALLAAFDDALNENPFLWFEIGYTRQTDWMVHIWDKRGGTEKKIVCTQDTDRDAACELAAEKLKRHMGKKPWDFAANSGLTDK